MTMLTRRTAITLSIALVAGGGLTGCGNNKPATTPSPTPTESSMMSGMPSDDSMMSEEPSDDSMMSDKPSDSMMEQDTDDE